MECNRRRVSDLLHTKTGAVERWTVRVLCRHRDLVFPMTMSNGSRWTCGESVVPDLFQMRQNSRFHGVECYEYRYAEPPCPLRAESKNPATPLATKFLAPPNAWNLKTRNFQSGADLRTSLLPVVAIYGLRAFWNLPGYWFSQWHWFTDHQSSTNTSCLVFFWRSRATTFDPRRPQHSQGGTLHQTPPRPCSGPPKT